MVCWGRRSNAKHISVYPPKYLIFFACGGQFRTMFSVYAQNSTIIYTFENTRNIVFALGILKLNIFFALGILKLKYIFRVGYTETEILFSREVYWNWTIIFALGILKMKNYFRVGHTENEILFSRGVYWNRNTIFRVRVRHIVTDKSFRVRVYWICVAFRVYRLDWKYTSWL